MSMWREGDQVHLHTCHRKTRISILSASFPRAGFSTNHRKSLKKILPHTIALLMLAYCKSNKIKVNLIGKDRERKERKRDRWEKKGRSESERGRWKWLLYVAMEDKGSRERAIYTGEGLLRSRTNSNAGHMFSTSLLLLWNWPHDLQLLCCFQIFDVLLNQRLRHFAQ